MKCYKRKIKSGELIEYEIYKAIRQRDVPGIVRGKNRGLTSEKQEKLNQINREKHCHRLINANFGQGDLYITLTHKKDVSEDEAMRGQQNFIRRLKYYIRKNDLPELKYIAVTELSGRWHTHMIINKIPMDVVMEIWGKGGIEFEPLYIEGHYKRLAAYIAKPNKKGKHWSQSRNLKQPEVTVQEARPRDIKRIQAGRPPVPPPGYREIYRELRDNEITGTSVYMCYERIHKAKSQSLGKKGAKHERK